MKLSSLLTGLPFLTLSCVSSPNQDASQSPVSSSDVTEATATAGAAGAIQRGSVFQVLESQIIEVKNPTDSALSNALNLGKNVTYGPGSGLRMVSSQNGVFQFLYVTDRGPNSDAPDQVAADGTKLASKIFQNPSFAPRFGMIEWDEKKKDARIVDARPLIWKGKEMKGIPLPQDAMGSSREVAIDAAQKVIRADPNGIDPESIDFDTEGHYYVSEEYRPSVLKLDSKTGAVSDIWEPGSGLPEIFKYRRPNRGLEGIAVTPGGDMLALLQSTMNVPLSDGPGIDRVNKKETKSGTSKTSPFIRGFRKNLNTGATTQFAYPIQDGFKSFSDAKIGDMIALSDTKFLVINQGKIKDGGFETFIELLDTEGACDLSNQKTKAAQELEFVESLKELEEICMPAKVTTLVSLSKFGWNHAKTEGIATDGDRKIFLINDNDFGVGEGGLAVKSEILVLTLKEPLSDL